MDRNMMLTSDEYIALMRLISSERESEGASLVARSETSRSLSDDRPSITWPLPKPMMSDGNDIQHRRECYARAITTDD